MIRSLLMCCVLCFGVFALAGCQSDCEDGTCPGPECTDPNCPEYQEVKGEGKPTALITPVDLGEESEEVPVYGEGETEPNTDAETESDQTPDSE